MSGLKSGVLRQGGSAWEFKIDGGANYDIQSNGLVVDSKIFTGLSTGMCN